MSKWDKITLFKYQQLEEITTRKIPELDKVLFSTCIVFDYTEFQLNEMDIGKVNKLANKLTEIVTTPIDPKPFNKIGKYFINYEVSKVTLGQYIELSYFLAEPLKNAHYSLASVTDREEDHKQKANYFLNQSIAKIIGSIKLLVDKLSDFNKEYKGLFGLDREVSSDAQNDPFNKQYGWIYSATQIAEHYRISLDEAMNLPVRQAFNGLAYLKALGKYQAEQLKQQSNAR